MKSIQSKVASLANHLFYSTTLTQSAAWKKAWAVVKLKKAMAEKEAVEFTFIKKDGSERPATGTLAATVVPAIKGTGKAKPMGIVTYYDIERKGWRSFKAENIRIAA